MGGCSLTAECSLVSPLMSEASLATARWDLQSAGCGHTVGSEVHGEAPALACVALGR